MANGQQVDGAVIVQREWRTLVRFALEGLAAGLVASLVFGLAVFIVTSPAIAATPDATGALYLKDAERPSHRDAARVHRRPHERHRDRQPRDGRAALPESDRRMARGRVRLSVARESRRRSPAHENRRARDRGHDQGARGSCAHVRSRQERGTQGHAARRGAPEHVHDERREHRSARRDRDRDRVPGSGALRRGYVPPAIPDGHHAAVHAGWRRHGRDARDAGRRAQRRLRAAGAHHDRPRHGRCRLRIVEHVSRHGHRAARRPSLSPDAARRTGAGRARLRARVDAGRRRRACDRAVHGNEGRQDLRTADGAAARGREAVGAHAAGSDVHHRHVGLDGRRVDDAGARCARDGARSPAAGGSIQRHRVQLDDALALRLAGGRGRCDDAARETVRLGAARPRRHRDAAGARDRARGSARSVDAAPGGVPHRRRGRQRRPDPASSSASASATVASSPSASVPRPTCSS